MRAEKKALQEKSVMVEARHLQPFLDAKTPDGDQRSESIHWQAAALARLMRVPEGFMRDKCKQRIEDYGRQNGYAEITLEVAEGGLKLARGEMEKNMHGQGAPDAKPKQGGCPFGHGKKKQ
jgi:hypothetical protein